MEMPKIPRPLGYAPAAIAAVAALFTLRRLWVRRRAQIETEHVTPLTETPEVML